MVSLFCGETKIRKARPKEVNFINKEKGMKRLIDILQDDKVKAAIVFVAIWSGVVAAVLIPLSPML